MVTLIWSWWWAVVVNEHQNVALTVLAISLLLFLYKWKLSYVRKVKTPLPPGPYGLPVVGYLPFLGSNLHERFTEMANCYGPIFSLWLGSRLHVVVNSTDLVKVVAHDLDQTFANRIPPVTALSITYGGYDILWSNNNRHWRKMRKVLAGQLLSNANLDATQSFRTHEVRKMVNKVYAKIGTKIKINEIAFDTQVNLVTSMLLGSSISDNGIRDGFQEVEFKIMKLLGAPNISDYLPMLSRFDLQGRQREMQKQLELVDQIFDRIIEGRRIEVNSSTVDEEGKDFLQMLLELNDQKDDPASFNIIQIKALLLDILIGATDTTSTMVEWVMAEILNNSSVLRKIQQELTEVIGTNKIVKELYLSKLTYLDAVIKETFRVHPPLPLLIQRSPDEPCRVGGYTIPKDTIVYMNIWAIHRDPKNWNDPLEFKPERFLNRKCDYNGNNLKFLPFGSGRRVCPGIPLGEKMLMYVLASMLHSFEWRLPKDEEFELSDEFGLVTKKRKPLIAIPFQRLSDQNLYL